MKKLLILLLLLITTILPTFATNWTCICEDKKTFIDLDSITKIDECRNGHQCYSFWVKSLNRGTPIEKKFENKNKQKIWYSMIMYKCCVDTKEIGIAYCICYNLKNQPIDNSQLVDGLTIWQPIIPNSEGETLYTIIYKIINH